MNSTFTTYLFNLRRHEKEDETHETSVNLQSQRKKSSKQRATWIPKSVANPGLFPLPKLQNEMYNESSSNPKCPTLAND